jgi:hypothetical protein
MTRTADRVLTEREVNRALLARQHLLDRAGTTLPRLLDRVAGIQGQYAPSMYVGLWSRLEGFQRDALTRALERRTVVQGTLMRTTIHLVSAGDYWPIAIAVREARRRWLLRVRPEKPRAVDLAAAAGRVRRHLAAVGSMSRAQIEELVGKGRMVGIGLWIDLVRVPPSGTWERRRADQFAAAEDWLGPPPEMSPPDAVDHLVRRYLGGFGPASRSDVSDFTGLSLGDVAPSLERIPLRRFRDQRGRELLDLRRAPLPDPETPAPVRFLPTWDATLLASARRTQILPERYRPLVFNTRTPHSLSTVLIDGQVAGAWRYEQGRIHVEPFHRLDRATLRELRDEAERLAGFHA